MCLLRVERLWSYLIAQISQRKYHSPIILIVEEYIHMQTNSISRLLILHKARLLNGYHDVRSDWIDVSYKLKSVKMSSTNCYWLIKI